MKNKKEQGHIPHELTSWYVCLNHKTVIEKDGEKLVSSDKILTMEDFLALALLFQKMEKEN